MGVKSEWGSQGAEFGRLRSYPRVGGKDGTVGQPDPPAPDGIPAPPGGKRRVLIADDDHEFAESLGLLLKMLGYETHIAHDGLEALESAAALRPEIALLDLGMPGMSDLDLARRIREQTWGRDILLIAVTGGGSPEDKRRTAAAGFDHHVVKPAEPAELEKLLASSRRPGTNR